MVTPVDRLPTSESEKRQKQKWYAAVIGLLLAAGMNVYQYVDQDMVKLGDETYALPNEMTDVEDAFAALQDIIADLNKQLEAKKVEYNTLNTSYLGCTADKASLQTKIDNLEITKTNLEKQITSSQGTADAYQLEIEDLKKKLADMEEKWNSATGCCSDKGAAIMELKAQIEDLQKQLKQAEQVIKQLQDMANPQLMDTTDSWLLGYAYNCVKDEIEKGTSGEFALYSPTDENRTSPISTYPIAWIIMPTSYTKTKTHYDEETETEYWVVEFDLHVIWAESGTAWCSLCCCTQDFHVKICVHLKIMCGYVAVPYTPAEAGQWIDPVILIEPITNANCVPSIYNPGPYTAQ